MQKSQQVPVSEVSGETPVFIKHNELIILSEISRVKIYRERYSTQRKSQKERREVSQPCPLRSEVILAGSC